eukprot:4816969-Amphidinium_carterae.1
MEACRVMAKHSPFAVCSGDTNLLVIGAHGLDLYVNGHRRVEDLVEVKLSGALGHVTGPMSGY